MAEPAIRADLQLSVPQLSSAWWSHLKAAEMHAIGFHALCDVSEVTISFGDWNHERGEEIDDLCEAEWAKLDAVSRRSS